MNGAYAWANNPWVWVIEFKRMEEGKCTSIGNGAYEH